jgi:cytolysin-activating lysine-acyltransferase
MAFIKVICPAIRQPEESEVALFGSIVWLWMHSKIHRTMPLIDLEVALMPALETGQFLLATAMVNGQETPAAYTAWANLNAETEKCYLLKPNGGLKHKDWQSGDRMWITDWFAPFGHAQTFRTLVGQELSQSCFRGLYHRGDEKGLRILHFRGNAVSADQAKKWWADKPIDANISRGDT